MAYNRVILVGRLTHDPELRYTQSGTAVTSFRIAVDRQTKDKQTDFLDIVAWRASGEFAAKNFVKGQEVLVEGKVQARNYEDKDGNKRTAVEIIADRFSFVGNRPQMEQREAGFTPIDNEEDAELPF